MKIKKVLFCLVFGWWWCKGCFLWCFCFMYLLQ